MDIRRIDVETRYSEAVVHNGTVYLSGQFADEGVEGIEAQTKQTLEYIGELLEKAGSGKDRILSATVYLKDMNDYDGLNRVWDAWLEQGTAPVRTCVQAPLAFPYILVEITVTAAVK